MKHANTSAKLAIGCNLFHFYAYSLYLFSAVSLAPIFFKTEGASFSKTLAVMTISLSLFLKPIGALIFGHIGDKYGRKSSLLSCLFGITFVTSAIGLIPEYNTIGVLSGTLLMILLLIQGICMGGQYTGALVFIQEKVNKKSRGLACGLVTAFGVLGTLLGTSVSLILNQLSDIENVWRLPFLTTSLIGIPMIFLIKNFMQESDEFSENRKDLGDTNPLPIWVILKSYKRVFLAAIFISAVPVSMFYTAAVYIPNFSYTQGSSSEALAFSCIAQFLCLILIPLLGYLGDRVGKSKQLFIASLFMVVSPIIIFLSYSLFNQMHFTVTYIIILSLFASLYSGPGPALLTESFPVIGRCTGLGIGISIGEGIFGGLAPLICLEVHKFYHSTAFSSFFISFIGALSLLGVLLTSSRILDKFKLRIVGEIKLCS